ncbi:MAG: CvpA family protein [Anaerolineae bacterium]|nr:CvpA family protein [Anaerolineae bacterium]
MDSRTFVGSFLGVFALIGGRRGVHREVLALMGILLAIVVSSTLAEAVQPQVNRLYRYGRAGINIVLGADDPGAEFVKASEAPDLVAADDLPKLHLAVFGLITLFFYVLGEVRMAAPKAIVPRVLGLFVGAVNGYAIASYLLPILFVKNVSVKVPAIEAQRLLSEGETVAQVLFFFVFVLIAFGLYTASGAKKGG